MARPQEVIYHLALIQIPPSAPSRVRVYVCIYKYIIIYNY